LDDAMDSARNRSRARGSSIAPPLVMQLPDGLLRLRNDSRELRIEAYRQ
jgi:hypothetical protein